MSLTAILWALLYCLALALSIVDPLFGALGYLLEYYMRPALKWWGDELPSLRYNLIVSITLGVTFLVRRSSLAEVAKTPNLPARWLVAMLAVMVFVGHTVAISRDLSVEYTIEWAKMAIIFPMLAAGVIRNRFSFNAFVVAHMLGAFWWGYEAWDDPKRVAGRLVSIGSGDSLNDNGAAAHLLTVLPFSVLYLLTERDIKLRLVGLLSAPFVINTLILCNSRGSMMGLLIAMALAPSLIKSGLRLRVIAGGLGLALAVLALADDQFITRQQTTARYEEDSSASQRLVTWQGAYQLVLDRPLGAGGRGFHLLSPIYIPSVVESHGGDLRAPHNTYAMVASEWGVAGLICFLGVYASAFLNVARIKRAAKAPDDAFFYWRAFAIQLAMIAYLVAGSFTDRLYAEAGYWMVGLSYALWRIQRTEHAAKAARVPASVDTADSHSPSVVALNQARAL